MQLVACRGAAAWVAAAFDRSSCESSFLLNKGHVLGFGVLHERDAYIGARQQVVLHAAHTRMPPSHNEASPCNTLLATSCSRSLTLPLSSQPHAVSQARSLVDRPGSLAPQQARRCSAASAQPAAGGRKHRRAERRPGRLRRGGPLAASARVAELRDGAQQRGVHRRRRADDAAVQVQPAPAPKVQRRAWPQRRAPRAPSLALRHVRATRHHCEGACPAGPTRAQACAGLHGRGRVSRQPARGCASSPCMQACPPAPRPRPRCDGAGAGCRDRQPRATRTRRVRPGSLGRGSGGPAGATRSPQSPRSGSAPQGSLRAGEGAGVGALTAAALARRARGRGRAGRVGDARAGLGHDQRAGRVVPDLLAVARVREAQVHARVPARQRACAPRAPLSPGARGRRPPARWSWRGARRCRLGRTGAAAAGEALMHRTDRERGAALGAAPAPACRPAFAHGHPASSPLHVYAGRRRPVMLAGPAPDAHGKRRPPVRAPKAPSLRGGKHARAAPGVPRPPAHSATRFWPLHARTRQPASSAPHHTWPGCQCAAAGA